MILVLLLLVPLVAMLAVPLVGRRSPSVVRWASVSSLLLELCLFLVALARGDTQGRWLHEWQAEWIPRLGISFHLALDAISASLVGLTIVLSLVAVLVSWKEVEDKVALFHASVLAIAAGVIGVFTAIDLVLFYVFWEAMLLPMFLLIRVFGHERRRRAALQFFVATQAASLLLLAAIVGLALHAEEVRGVLSFDWAVLLQVPLDADVARLCMLGFLIAFLVKLPAVPFHGWLPDAHTEAPTAGSVLLAGLLLKTGGYGILRFAIPLFPEASRDATGLVLGLGLFSVLYGAWLALGQTDFKRLVAYTSVSHLGFVLLGAYAWNELALQGVLLQMLCHGFSTGALFVVAGYLRHHVQVHSIGDVRGLSRRLPRLSRVTLFFAMASLGLPGLGNFVAEFLILVGVYREYPVTAALAAISLVFATLYSLRLFQELFHGPPTGQTQARDLGWRESLVFAGMGVLLLFFGLWPTPFLDWTSGAFENLLRLTERGLPT